MILVALIAISLTGGYYLGKSFPDCPETAKSKTVSGGKTETIVEVKRPDGTVETWVERREEPTVAETSESKPANSRKDYSVEVRIPLNSDVAGRGAGVRDLEVSASRRLLLDFWGTISYNVGAREVSAGLRFDF